MIVDVVFVVSGSSPEFNHNWQEQSSCGIFDMEVIVMSVRSLSRPGPGLTDGDINIAENRTIILLLLQTGVHEDLGKINIKDYVHNCVHCTFIIVNHRHTPS